MSVAAVQQEHSRRIQESEQEANRCSEWTGWRAERGTTTARWHYQGFRATRHLLKDQPAERDWTSECSWCTVWWRAADGDQVGLTAGLGTGVHGGGRQQEGAGPGNQHPMRMRDRMMSRRQGEHPHTTGRWASAAIMQELHCSPRSKASRTPGGLFIIPPCTTNCSHLHLLFRTRKPSLNTCNLTLV